ENGNNLYKILILGLRIKLIFYLDLHVPFFYLHLSILSFYEVQNANITIN
ncbi:hypothetical protein LCGC14_1991990, partial [marine sediment metagenome]